MTAYTSNSAGILVLPEPDQGEFQIVDLISGEQENPKDFRYKYSVVQDWEEIEESDTDDILEKATQEYRTERATSLLQEALSGHSEKLTVEIFEEVEELLSVKNVSSQKVLDRLLIAPLMESDFIKPVASLALSNEFAAITSILDNLNELQPLLRKFAGVWLKLDNDIFQDFTIKKEEIWIKIVKDSGISQLIQIDNKSKFLTQWNLLVFALKAPQDKKNIPLVGKRLCEYLYPHQSEKKAPLAHIKTRPKNRQTKESPDQKDFSIHKIYTQVNKQKEAILTAIKKGEYSKAEKFVRELINMQLETPKGKKYVVKSLCDIAQRCAESFIWDFEKLCLERAFDISPDDPWLLIQYGNHSKRNEKYEQAVELLKKASKIAESPVAKSSLADVYTNMGDFGEAIKIYKSIPEWKSDQRILTALADIKRKKGDYDKAEADYHVLIKEAQKKIDLGSELRAKIGLAEIAKQKGDLSQAVNLYEEVLALGGDEEDHIYFELGYCNVLKRMGKYDLAYKVIDGLVQAYPFALRAKYIRASILGLENKASEALKELPEIESKSWHEWLRNYCRGLILLKLDRFKEAREHLIDKFPSLKAPEEDKNLLRMGAALWYLGQNKFEDAERKLADLSIFGNDYTAYLLHVIELHIAAKKEDKEKFEELKNKLAKIKFFDKNLAKATQAIESRNFKKAEHIELEALLKAAS